MKKHTPLCSLGEWVHRKQIEKANPDIKLLKKNVVEVTDERLKRIEEGELRKADEEELEKLRRKNEARIRSKD